MVIAGECHGNHEDQRKHSEHGNAQRGQEHQQDVSLGIEQLADIVHEARSLAVLLEQHLGLVCRAHGHDPQADEGSGDNQSGDTVQQDDHGTVRFGVDPEAVDQLLAACIGAQGRQLGKIVHAIDCHEHEVCDFQRQHGNALDILLAHDIAKTKHHCGKLSEQVTTPERRPYRVRRRRNIISTLLPKALHLPRGKSCCCHFDCPLIWILKDKKSFAPGQGEGEFKNLARECKARRRSEPLCKVERDTATRSISQSCRMAGGIWQCQPPAFFSYWIFRITDFTQRSCHRPA